MLVRDIMSQDINAVTTHTTLADTISKMAAREYSCSVVLDQNKPVGIITERDITKEFAKMLSKRAYLDTKVSEIMTPYPLCVSGEDSVKDVLALSRSRGLRHLPVIDQHGDLIGLVTQGSLLDGYASLIEQQQVLEDNIDELTHLSLEDPLLKIGNRRAMEVDLSFTEVEAKRHKKSFAIALLDIDFFKKYNDSYGHQSGDKTLFKVAQAIKKSLRDSDRVFRYGGEEILVLMPETEHDQAEVGAERARQAVEDLGIPHESSEYGVVTISGGVVAKQGGKWKSMIAKADEALYRAKEEGRNRIRLANL